MFFKKLGFKDQSIQLIKPYVVQKKRGTFLFPFSHYKEFEINSGEELTVDRRIRHSNDGLFLIEPVENNFKDSIYYFDSVLSMMCFYDCHNAILFENSLFVVIPLIPKFKPITDLITSYNLAKTHTLVLPKTTTGICQEILLTSSINNIEGFRIKKDEDTLLISGNNRFKKYHLDDFSLFNFKRDFNILRKPNRVVDKKPKNFSSYIEKHFFYENN
ncbi:hypothetical protein [Sphingobacterium sp.]|uniref:hypothetical protein n=1 Tax=Sphingobacterium sp. TaxID=341027 RepID=UPI0028A9639F|nr:hypothetical protein [Sphingobacterium sp.]